MVPRRRRGLHSGIQTKDLRCVVCVCVCVCDAQIFQIMVKLRGSTMMRPNHEFFCSVALSPGCVCVGGGGDAILERKACMGPGVGAQRRGPVPKRMSDENHHDCTGPP